LQHDFLRRKKFFHIVKYGPPSAAGEKKPVHGHRFFESTSRLQGATGVFLHTAALLASAEEGRLPGGRQAAAG